jgi:hypothetical protein
MKTLSSKNGSINRLKRKLHPHQSDLQDHSVQDIKDVIISASLLQISEFRFFQLSYAHWYGRDISEREIEHIFITYMFSSFVPH